MNGYGLAAMPAKYQRRATSSPSHIMRMRDIRRPKPAKMMLSNPAPSIVSPGYVRSRSILGAWPDKISRPWMTKLNRTTADTPVANNERTKRIFLHRVSAAPSSSALRKSDPLVLGRSDPGQEQDWES
jgi:hypothetical protein